MTKITLDLDVPDDLAARVADLPISTVNRYAVAALRDAADTTDEEADDVWTEDEKRAVYASLAISFAEADAGQDIPAEEVFALLDARTAQSK